MTFYLCFLQREDITPRPLYIQFYKEFFEYQETTGGSEREAGRGERVEV